MNREVLPKMPSFDVVEVTPPTQTEEPRAYRPPESVVLVIRADLPISDDEDCYETAEGEVGRFIKIRFEYGALEGMTRDGKWHDIGTFHRDAIVGGLMKEKTRCGNPGKFIIELGAV